jgi:hypothetical protein
MTSILEPHYVSLALETRRCDASWQCSYWQAKHLSTVLFIHPWKYSLICQQCPWTWHSNKDIKATDLLSSVQLQIKPTCQIVITSLIKSESLPRTSSCLCSQDFWKVDRSRNNTKGYSLSIQIIATSTPIIRQSWRTQDWLPSWDRLWRRQYTA